METLSTAASRHSKRSPSFLSAGFVACAAQAPWHKSTYLSSCQCAMTTTRGNMAGFNRRHVPSVWRPAVNMQRGGDDELNSAEDVGNVDGFYPKNGSSSSSSSSSGVSSSGPSAASGSSGSGSDSDSGAGEGAGSWERPVSDVKCELFAALASVNRGFSLTGRLRRTVEGLVADLESRAAGVDLLGDSATRDLLVGNWRLVYTNAPDVLFLGLLPTFAVTTNQIFQSVTTDGDGFKLRNVIELEPAVSTVLRGSNRTLSELVMFADASVQDGRFLGVSFSGAQILPQSILGFQLPSRVQAVFQPLRVRSPSGPFETTYLDEDIRIGRAPFIGGINSVFVLVREPDS